MVNIRLLLLGLFSLSSLCFAEQRINFFVQTYPELGNNPQLEKLLKDAANPKKAIPSILAADPTSKPFSGLFATYAGYVTVSSPFNGQISFPRKQENPLFYIVVTPRIEPVMMLGATVHHWQLIKDLPVEFYTVDRKKDKDTNISFWSVRKADVPGNGIVPLSSIVIFAKPKNLYIPLGITPANDNPQLVLPTIYVRKGIDLVTSALSILNVKHFFRSIRTTDKKGSDKSWLSNIEK